MTVREIPCTGRRPRAKLRICGEQRPWSGTESDLGKVVPRSRR